MRAANAVGALREYIRFRVRAMHKRTRIGEATFGKFTKEAQRVLQFAQEEAQRLNHDYLGTEHILLGLLREGDGRDDSAGSVLKNLGVELQAARSAVESMVGTGERPIIGEIGLTPRAKRVIGLAVDEARRMGHNYLGTKHLLLGLVRESDGIGTKILSSLGVTEKKVRSAVEDVRL
jgi:ATP-dependent Clp protease ATP-binding subunit ClpC